MKKSATVPTAGLAISKAHEGLFRCARCHGVVTKDAQGRALTPVKGEVHDCERWEALGVALEDWHRATTAARDTAGAPPGGMSTRTAAMITQ